MFDLTYNMKDLIDFVFLLNPSACLTYAILAPTNAQIDEYNHLVLQRVLGVERKYACLLDPGHILDYVPRQHIRGLPPHDLTIKVNRTYRMLQNLSIDKGLVKNVRIVITAIANHLITVQILCQPNYTPSSMNDNILIPRITFLTQLPTSGYTLQRKQFPLSPAYATTFNSCQGLTLDFVGIGLTTPAFSHGQFYAALSRIRRCENVRIHLKTGVQSTINVTYHDLLI
jgi:ATP-dependent DNA helicase PIF1